MYRWYEDCQGNRVECTRHGDKPLHDCTACGTNCLTPAGGRA